MTVYFSGIGGVGIGPLAEIAQDAGYIVTGSDLAESPQIAQLRERGVAVDIGQDGSQIAKAHRRTPIGWFVYTSALPDDHPELQFARAHNIRISKRDEFLATFIAEKQLQLIAVAGTHGKTTTTGMLIWVLRALGEPISYSIGTSVSWGPSGQYSPDSRYFTYECDEYDRNFLHFSPAISIITALDYDHPDTYPSEDAYRAAFVQFLQQSAMSLMWEKDLRYLHTDPQADLEAYDENMDLSHITLAGKHVRQNAFLVQKTLEKLFVDDGQIADTHTATSQTSIVDTINAFPGTARRFEKLADNLYSDYGHHPSEIAATLQMASEISDHIVLVYQPHQNIRQHEIRDRYTDEVFKDAAEVYWLPTYLSREDPSLETLTPEQLSAAISGNKVHPSEMNDELWDVISRHRDAGHLVLVMGAGSIDSWIRKQLNIKYSAEILVTDTRGNFVMQHRDNIPTITNPDMITSFGGSVDEGESVRQAAHRELSEETNLRCDINDLKYLITLFQPLVRDGTSRWCTFYTLENQNISDLKTFEGQGFKVIPPHDLSNHKLSDMAQKATSYFIEQSNRRAEKPTQNTS